MAVLGSLLCVTPQATGEPHTRAAGPTLIPVGAAASIPLGLDLAAPTSSLDESATTASPRNSRTATAPLGTDTAETLVSEVLLAPRCPATRLDAISELSDTRQSLATLRDLPSGKQRTLRVGGSIGGYRVAHIGDNRALAAPSVWLWDGTALCQTLLDRAHRGVTSVAAVAPSTPPPARVRPGLSARVAQAVSVRSSNHRAVPRALVEDVLDHIGELDVTRRWVAPNDGSDPGWQLGFAPGSTLDSLGLRDGDRLLQVNGAALASPRQALQAYMRLRGARELEAVVLRQGERVKLTISVE